MYTHNVIFNWVLINPGLQQLASPIQNTNTKTLNKLKGAWILHLSLQKITHERKGGEKFDKTVRQSHYADKTVFACERLSDSASVASSCIVRSRPKTTKFLIALNLGTFVPPATEVRGNLLILFSASKCSFLLTLVIMLQLTSSPFPFRDLFTWEVSVLLMQTWNWFGKIKIKADYCTLAVCCRKCIHSVLCYYFIYIMYIFFGCICPILIHR